MSHQPNTREVDAALVMSPTPLIESPHGGLDALSLAAESEALVVPALSGEPEWDKVSWSDIELDDTTVNKICGYSVHK
ncbi:MAG: hypothetical protein ACRDL7_02960, partial [Gaiellaceae bacterium]